MDDHFAIACQKFRLQRQIVDKFSNHFWTVDGCQMPKGKASEIDFDVDNQKITSIKPNVTINSLKRNATELQSK